MRAIYLDSVLAGLRHGAEFVDEVERLVRAARAMLRVFEEGTMNEASSEELKSALVAFKHVE